jgi:hypothetical protein
MSIRMIKDVVRTHDIKTHCPLCGREAAKAPHTAEHVFPKWLQRRHDLLNRRLAIPNLVGRKYKSIKIGVCEPCNNRRFGRLETRISRAMTFMNPFAELSALGRDDVAAWLGKILWLLARKSHSVEDHRTRHRAKPERILPSELMVGLLYLGIFMRCFARGKRMYSCYSDDLPIPALFYGAPYSLYFHEIDTRDDRFEPFDFIDNSLVAGVAIRSGNVGMICLFDGGLHKRFRSGRFAYLDGHRLHPAQFTELVARIFYDQTVLDPEACRVTYYSNRPLKAIVAQTSGRRSYDPYIQELHDPSRLARMLAFYTSQEPDSLLFEGGRTFTSLQRPDGAFMRFAVTPDEIEAARRDPAQHLVWTDISIRRRLAEEASALDSAETQRP